MACGKVMGYLRGLSWAVFEVICVTELGFPCGLRVADCKA